MQPRGYLWQWIVSLFVWAPNLWCKPTGFSFLPGMAPSRVCAGDLSVSLDARVTEVHTADQMACSQLSIRQEKNLCCSTHWNVGAACYHNTTQPVLMHRGQRCSEQKTILTELLGSNCWEPGSVTESGEKQGWKKGRPIMVRLELRANA